MRTRTWATPAGLVALATLALPALASAESEAKFNPSDEFKLDPYVSIHIGSLDMSINKAVVYLFIASAICIGIGLLAMRGGLRKKPAGAQNVMEMAYEFAESQIARPTLTEKMFPKYFPYIATLFLFIAVNNLISFIPLPVGHEGHLLGTPLHDLGLYAATANINVTLALTICTFLIYNYEGIRAHGPIGYLKTLVPEAPGAIKPIIFVLELLSQLLRLVSLSVRLFANLLAGHLLIIMCAGFTILLGNYAGVAAIPVGVFFYAFEWVLIAGLQAFIFAMLSGIYIGFAVEAGH
ncbi:MAG: F0F1 ATP synthase subunit A [Thermoleophilia bacterium]